MSLPTVSVLQDDLQDVYDAIADDPTRWMAKHGVQQFNEIASVLQHIYKPTSEYTVTDATDATIAAFLDTGGEGEALRVKQVFRTLGTGDTTANDFATAKGTALAANDVWVVDTATTVKYLGNYADTSIPDFFSGLATADFVNL